MVYYLPRYVITGSIGGIGVFVTVIGFEVSGEAVKFVSGHFTWAVASHSETETLLHILWASPRDELHGAFSSTVSR